MGNRLSVAPRRDTVMASSFWDIPGMRSKESLAFLERFLDPICVYGEQGQPIYASPSFLRLFKVNTAENVGFFRYFVSSTVLPSVWTDRWQAALQGESVWFLAQVKATAEEIECSLQFNPDANLMYLMAQRSTGTGFTPEQVAAYEQFVLALFDRPGLATALISLDGTMLKCNQRLHELLGTTETETIDLDDFVHPDDRFNDLDFKQKLLAGEIESYTLEKRLIDRNNEIIWVNVTLSLLDISNSLNGDSQYFSVLLEDITESKQVYNALIRMEGKWEAVVLNSLNLFIQTSNTGQIINASKRVEQIFGYPEAALLGIYMFDLIHPDDRVAFAEALQQWVRTPHLNHPGIECRWKTQSGAWADLLIRGQTFPAALEIDGIMLSGYDVTERKQLEADLKASEDRLKSLFANVPGAVFRCDSTYAMNFISDGIEAITGYPASEFINDRIQSFFDIIYPDDIELIKRSLIQCIFERQSNAIEYRVFHTNGSVHWVLERKQAIFDEEGSLLWFDGLLMDISDRACATA
jgi:PAS domain S-box-containing protein